MPPPLGFLSIALVFICGTLSAQERERLMQLESPEEAVQRGAVWALRVDLDPSFETPLTFIVSATDSDSRVSVYRFVEQPRTKGNLDLFYRPKFEAPFKAPTWLRELQTIDKETGLDGMNVAVEFADAQGVHEVHRWSPEYKAAERNLKRFVGLINDLLRFTGINTRPRIRHQKWSEELVDISIPVSPSFVAAAKRVEARHKLETGEILNSMHLEGGTGELVRFDADRKTVHGRARQRGAVALTAALGRIAFASEDHIFEELHKAAVGIANDPFGTRQQETKRVEQDGSGQPATAPESKLEGNEKPKPESEVRPR